METITSPQPGSAASWTERFSTPTSLDGHFALARPEYEAALAEVGVARGARVLDAGCGPGGFTTLLADAVGAGGHITAVDLEENNLVALRDRYQKSADLETLCASVCALPVGDASFDLAWCANVTTYLVDDEVDRLLRELARVVRPGGRVVLKEVDADLLRISAIPRVALRRLLREAASFSTLAAGILRAADLHHWLARACLRDVEHKAHLVQRRAPLCGPARAYVDGVLEFFAGLAQRCEQRDAAWGTLVDPVRRRELVDDPGFFWTEGFVVVSGRCGDGPLA